MTSQTEIITSLLNTNTYDIYEYYTDETFGQKLDEIKAFGKIQKYVVWKKLLTHLSKRNYYDVLNRDNSNLIKFIDLLEDKFTFNQPELKKIYNLISMYNLEKIETTKQLMLKLLERAYICNNMHLSFLININEEKPINKLDEYIIDYLKKKPVVDVGYFNNEIEYNLFFDIIFSDIFRNNILLNKNGFNDENIKNLLSKFDITSIIFNIEKLTIYFYNKYVFMDPNIPTFIDCYRQKDYYKKKELSNITKNIKVIEECIKFFIELSRNIVYMKYKIYSEPDINSNIDTNNIIKLSYTLFINKKIYNRIINDIFEEKIILETESARISKTSKASKTSNKSKSNIIDYYCIFGDYDDYDDCDDSNIKLQKEINKILYKDTKLGEKILNEYDTLINHIKVCMPYLKACDYYILDKIQFNAESYGNLFLKFILEIYKNSREYINESNIDQILDLSNYDKFIDITNEKNKKILLNMINNKILNCKTTIYVEDLKICGFDETTLKNALLHDTFYSHIISYMLENKYQLCEKDYLYMYYNYKTLNDFNNVKKLLLDKFTEYNVYMSKNTLLQFCKNQKFYYNFDFKLLKNYTLFKNEDDKIFNQIIDEIKIELKIKLKLSNDEQQNDEQQNNEEQNYNELYNIQKYIDNLINIKNKIELNDIFKLCDPHIKYIFNKYLEQEQNNININTNTNTNTNTNINKNIDLIDTTKPKKVVVKKVIKKS